MNGVKLIGWPEALETAEEMTLEVLQKATLQVANGVTERMPVDTGRARGGTQTSIGSPRLDDPGRLDKGGQAAIFEAQAATEQAELGDDLFVANAVEYVSFLEDGSSNQAPQGMFQITVDHVAGQFN